MSWMQDVAQGKEVEKAAKIEDDEEGRNVDVEDEVEDKEDKGGGSKVEGKALYEVENKFLLREDD